MLDEERFRGPTDEGGGMRRRRVGFGRISALLIPLGVVTYLIGGVLSLLEYQDVPEHLRAGAHPGSLVASVLWLGIGMSALGLAALCAHLVRRARHRRLLR